MEERIESEGVQERDTTDPTTGDDNKGRLIEADDNKGRLIEADDNKGRLIEALIVV
jgi:hypothetical protein